MSMYDSTDQCSKKDTNEEEIGKTRSFIKLVSNIESFENIKLHMIMS